jgi:hypothetical protein
MDFDHAKYSGTFPSIRENLAQRGRPVLVKKQGISKKAHGILPWYLTRINIRIEYL